MIFPFDRRQDTAVAGGFPINVRTLNEFDHIILPRLKQRSLPGLRSALRTHLQSQFETPIRHVVAYEEHVLNGGACETCSFDFTVFDVYFKDSSGRTLLWRYTGEFRMLLLQLAAATTRN